MVVFECDWCKAIKKDGAAWLMGLAAESIGITAARREITILPGWDSAQACHPLAVHFCSGDHKDKYMAALFETEALPAETVIKSRATVAPNAAIERQYLRTASVRSITSGKKKRPSRKTRRSA